MGKKMLMLTDGIYSEIRKTILEARHHVYTAVNSAMVQTYWNIGRIIVEHEQEGKERAEYGTGLLKNLAQRLTDEFGRGFTEHNLRNMRTFYQKFPKWHTVRAELSWSHYRLYVERHLTRHDRKRLGKGKRELISVSLSSHCAFGLCSLRFHSKIITI